MLFKKIIMLSFIHLLIYWFVQLSDFHVDDVKDSLSLFNYFISVNLSLSLPYVIIVQIPIYSYMQLSIFIQKYSSQPRRFVQLTQSASSEANTGHIRLVKNMSV